MRVPLMTHTTPDLPEAPPPPGAQTLLEPFAALAALRRRVADMLPETHLSIAYDPDRFSAGTHLLADVPAEALGPSFLATAEHLLPGLADIFPPLGREATILAQGLAMQPRLAVPLLAGFEQVRPQDFAQLAEELGLSPAALIFLVREILSTVLRREARTLSPLADDVLWQKPSCPICGAGPDVGMLKEQRDPSEFLISKAGRLLLHCSLCGHVWRFPRLVCVGCGEGNQENLDVLIPAGRDRERIHACRTCGRYLIVLNRVDAAADVDLDVAPAGLVHLDIVAQSRGYEPLCPAPWNQLNDE